MQSCLFLSLQCMLKFNVYYAIDNGSYSFLTDTDRSQVRLTGTRAPPKKRTMILLRVCAMPCHGHCGQFSVERAIPGYDSGLYSDRSFIASFAHFDSMLCSYALIKARDGKYVG